MGRMLPVFLAFTLNCSGVYVFTSPKSLDCLPYLSYVIFLLSVLFLLWDVNLRPVSFRKLFSCAELLIEFAVSMLLMEVIMNNFWFPLEIGFISFLPKVADFVSDTMYRHGFSCTGVCDFVQMLKWPGTLLIASYLLSVFFFICIIHATRVVDFRVLRRCGASAFINDTLHRGRKFYSKLLGSIVPTSCDNKKIYFAPGTKSGPCSRKRVTCEDDDDEEDEWINRNECMDADDYCSCGYCSSHCGSQL